MSPAAIMRELRDGQGPTTRAGLQVLVLGAALVLFVVIALSPSMEGLASLPGHVLDRPVGEAPARTAPPAQPRLTPMQKMVARRTAVKVALTQFGVRERGINGGDRLVMYRRAVTGPGERARAREPWCADFVSWAWKRAGSPIGFGGKGSDYVPELVLWARLTGRWKWARDGYRPRSGDLIVYNNRSSRSAHVGLVVKTTRGRVHTVEGNFRDRVSRRALKPWDRQVTGFIAPV